ncbi:Far1-related sequence 3 [Hibiscus syriacus]|uniref:Far1-related sequence 3 n=1 Tax=Hibiscus syriacus TaxID=106335 RepID=A0A6A2YYP3_HIBSY|nr:Far1-related sequence 3 [Hibiscus syriacus]
MLLYKSFPLLFSALVTASPVLVCTAVLLGTLLSFGSPYLPRIDEKEGEEEKVSHEVSELKKGATEDHTVVERDVGDDDFVIERHVGKRRGMVEEAEEKVSLVDNGVSEVEENVGSVPYKLLVNDDLDSRNIHSEDGVIDEADGSSHDSLVEKKRETREEILGSEDLLSMAKASDDHHVLADKVRDGNLEVEDHKLEDLSDDQRGEQFDSSLVFAWKGSVDDDDSGPGDAESCSPAASVADIVLKLDELDPLLGSEAPQPVQLSDDGSDAASERSHGSNNDGSVESNELENQEEDNDEDDGDAEGAKGDKEDESKSAIRWTEDDQKNLMDLGTSELERNQRLHNLIARRRARKSMGSMIEKNLLGLDSVDIPLNITPVSVTRRNPFEYPYDSYDDLGFPPIPGSAPSILQPRRNPFDLPYDSGEEKPDLKGDSFQEEFAGFNQRETVPQREAFLRRHESFNVGPSSLGVTRKELKWKPYFVLETEGSSQSSFQRQLSDVSESKLSSVPDTESVSSVVDEEDSKSCEQDISQEAELMANEVHASHDEQESLSSGDIDPMDVEQVENRVVRREVVEITLGDGESQLDMELNLPEAGASAHVELNGIEIEPMSRVGQPENRDVHHDVVAIESGDGENQQETESNVSKARARPHVELNPSEIHPKTKSVDKDFSSVSSFSLSEIDEKISVAREEGSAGFEPRGHEINGSGIFSQPSFEESEHFTVKVVDDKHSEPIYDSSPSVEKVLSFSSVSSDGQAGTSEMGAASMLAESTDKEPEGHAETTQQGVSSFQKMHDEFSYLLENRPRARDLPEISEHGVTRAGSLSVSTTSADHNVSMVLEPVVEYVSRDAVSSSSDEGSEDGVPNKE